MTSKRRLDQLKSARDAAVQACKKRKSEASSVLNTHSEIEDDKLSTADTSDTEDESGNWFWNESANESGSDTEEEDDDENESDLEVEESGAVSPEVPKKERANFVGYTELGQGRRQKNNENLLES